ncbi:hypothetical protein J2Y89_002191 [Curtobacterium herbarum]|uniref:hypothetical protein n=1 Tax=Curtobacterium herbarum TaxID=150122 RepID=UPI0020A1F427|nr:hypothetical protein [Curtobacterium herbarum]MCP1503447.1 hypothetical protein [Curtobacterium herbarum]
MSMSSAFDPSKGLAIPEEQISDDGLELDEDPAALGIQFEVVSGGTADPAAALPPREPGEDDSIS